MARALTGSSRAKAAATVAAVVETVAETIAETVDVSRSVEGVVKNIHGRNVLFEAIRKARHVREHRRGAAATTAKGAGRATDVMQLREGEASESIGVRRHGRAGKRSFGRGRDRLVVRTLHEQGFVVRRSLQDLSSGNVPLFSSSLVIVDRVAILMLNVGTLLSQSMALLLPSLLGCEPFLVGGDKTVMLLVESDLTLLETFSLL